MSQRTEQEIMKDWNYIDKPLVSVCCITYNHESYIRDAIEGFLMQETSFPFEVIIHDDASKDNTVDIIREYATKYPRIIKPIFQEENQYSKGIKISSTFVWPKAKGKYIALCEGDDYWIDSCKLQVQLDYIKCHPECSMVCHAALIVSPDKKSLKSRVRPNKGNKFFNVEDVIEGGGGLFATNSLFYLSALTTELPDFFEKAPVGDYPLMIFLALCGKVYYIDKFFSVYRKGVKGSWTSHISSDVEKLARHYDRVLEMLNEVNQYTNYRYRTTIVKREKYLKFSLLTKINRRNIFKEVKLKNYYLSLDIKSKIKIFIKQFFKRH